jgi:hypothetical protein
MYLAPWMWVGNTGHRSFKYEDDNVKSKLCMTDNGHQAMATSSHGL